MTAAEPIRHALVLLGGGHAHVAVLKRFGMAPLPGLHLTVVSPSPTTPYSGMLPGLLAGHYTPGETRVELRPLCRFANADFIHAPAIGLDLDHHQVLLRDRPPVRFDTLSINTGSSPAVASVPGAAELAIPVKPVEPFLTAWNRLHHQLLHHPPPPGRPFRIAVVGGGAGSVELILALRHRLQSAPPDSPAAPNHPELHLVTGAPFPLPTHGKLTRRLAVRALARHHIVTHANRRVAAVHPGELLCEGNHRIPFDVLLWATHAAPPPWIAHSGLATDTDGFIAVHPTLQSTSHPFIFAAGDVASMVGHPRPKSGVHAVRQGPPLARNLRRWILGLPPRPHRPQRLSLSLISTGDRHAVASYGPLGFSGRWIWQAKDAIDRRWLRQYQDLPAMSSPPARVPTPPAVAGPDHPPPPRPCGGCGSKVPADVLARVLARIRPETRHGLILGLDAPDDAAVIEPPPGLCLVQSTDFLRSLVNDPHLFGRLAAIHALNDLFAMGARPHSALATAVVPFGLPTLSEETLFQLLSGAVSELEAHDATLAGGHSSEGPEPAFGLTVNGWARREELLRKSGLRPGDSLVLTHPLGVGTLFAADMAGRARGDWIEAALESMLRSTRDAAGCLVRHGARACTDVTGFGLAGHLLEMLRASNVSAEIDPDHLPALRGARECLAAGIVSTLHARNASHANLGSARRRHLPDPEPRFPPSFALLFDPQTCGGLLAGIPAPETASCLAALRAAGYPDAAVIGRVTTPASRTAPPEISIRELPPAR